MGPILDRMLILPTGGWDIADFEDLNDWAKSIKDALEPSKSLRKIVVDLKSLSARIEVIAEPAEFEDEISDGHDNDLPSKPATSAKVEPGTSSSVIHVSGGKKPKEEKEEKLVAQHPMVRPAFPC
jgi:hypothetical protein